MEKRITVHIGITRLGKAMEKAGFDYVQINALASAMITGDFNGIYFEDDISVHDEDDEDPDGLQVIEVTEYSPVAR